jgi:NADP-dependent 3-hydroxy acid dehydrogenase YdfG
MAEGERVMLITGASTGIGAETARQAAQAGYRVVLAARSAETLEELVGELGAEQALAVPTDVSEWDANEKLVAAAIDAFGRIDVVFANAGFGASRGFLEESPEHWRSMVNTNVLGVAYTIRATLPHLLERKAGHYVITSSVAGRRVLPGSLYSASKWAVTAIGEALRQELRDMQPDNMIRVTVVEPGMVDTPFFDDRPGPDRALHDSDIARAVMYATSQPERVDVNEILIRPSKQRN